MKRSTWIWIAVIVILIVVVVLLLTMRSSNPQTQNHMATDGLNETRLNSEGYSDIQSSNDDFNSIDESLNYIDEG